MDTTRRNAAKKAVDAYYAGQGRHCDPCAAYDDFRKLIDRKDIDLGGLTQQMTVETSVNPEVKVILKADKDIPYEKLAQVLDAIKMGGVEKVALAMDRK